MEENNNEFGESQFPENDAYNQQGEQQGSVLDSGAPKVAASKGKILLIIFLLVLFILFIISLFSEDDTKEEIDLENQEPREISRPIEGAIIDMPDIEPPSPPILPDPPMPAPIASTGDLDLAENREELEAERRRRLQSDMLIASGSGGTVRDDEADEEFVGKDQNLAFANAAVRRSKAEKEYAGKIRNLNTTIAQGKVIEAVLETAIDTQLPGTIRAIVSRDTFAESGRAKLIPKGSRLIGTYNTSMFRGQNRVFIVWTRVIRPDGIDMMIDSIGSDSLGRSGVAGFRDNRYDDIFSAAILTSIISIAAAKGSEELLGDSNTATTNNSDGSTTTNQTSTASATNQAISTIAATGSGIIRDMIDGRQVITVDQGARVNIFVSKDLIFPNSVAGHNFIN